MDFSLIDFLDESACYSKLLELLHPDGLACPHFCRRVFNAWTRSVLEGTYRRASPT